MASYYAGLDLGHSADYTALAVLQKVPTYDPRTGKHSTELHLRHLERYPLKTPYTDIADQVRACSPALPSPPRDISWLGSQAHHRTHRG
jgi:hypothetical protein